MNEQNVSDVIKRCKVDLTPGTEKSWSLKITDIDEGCLDALKGIAKRMGPENRKFLGKRLVGETPQIDQILKELKLK